MRRSLSVETASESQLTCLMGCDSIRYRGLIVQLEGVAGVLNAPTGFGIQRGTRRSAALGDRQRERTRLGENQRDSIRKLGFTLLVAALASFAACSRAGANEPWREKNAQIAAKLNLRLRERPIPATDAPPNNLEPGKVYPRSALQPITPRASHSVERMATFSTSSVRSMSGPSKLRLRAFVCPMG
jgi:hypothetical protein